MNTLKNNFTYSSYTQLFIEKNYPNYLECETVLENSELQVLIDEYEHYLKNQTDIYFRENEIYHKIRAEIYRTSPEINDEIIINEAINRVNKLSLEIIQKAIESSVNSSSFFYEYNGEKHYNYLSNYCEVQHEVSEVIFNCEDIEEAVECRGKVWELTQDLTTSFLAINEDVETYEEISFFEYIDNHVEPVLRDKLMKANLFYGK